MQIGSRIQKFRKEKGLSRESLAADVGVASSTILRWEKGQLVPSFDNVMTVCGALGLRVSELIDEEVTTNFTPNLPLIFNFLSENSDLIEKLSILPSDELDIIKDMTEASIKAVEKNSSKQAL